MGKTKMAKNEAPNQSRELVEKHEELGGLVEIKQARQALGLAELANLPKIKLPNEDLMLLRNDPEDIRDLVDAEHLTSFQRTKLITSNQPVKDIGHIKTLLSSAGPSKKSMTSKKDDLEEWVLETMGARKVPAPVWPPRNVKKRTKK